MGRRIASVGLRWRIAAWAVVVILLCLGIAFVAVYRGAGSELRGQIDSEITGDVSDLQHSLRGSGESSPARLSAAATRYVRSRPFSSSSTLMFATVTGRGTSTNRPELFRAEKPDNGENRSQQEHENNLSARLLDAPVGFSTLALPDVGNLRVLTRALVVRGENGTATAVRIGVGEPLASVTRAQEGVARAFILGGSLAVLAALLGGLLIGSRASRPLRRMAAVAERVDAGDLQPRIHPAAGVAAEVAVLAGAFNHMLDRLTAAFASQREFVADASHELRTPLTVIRGQLEVLAEDPAPTAEEVRRVERLLLAEVTRIDRLVDDLLLLAQLEQSEFLQPEELPLRPFLAELWETTTLLADRRFELGEIPSGTLLADPDRLAQALRNLLTNAIKHTAEGDGKVRLRVEAEGADRLRFVVEDDGPGIPPEDRERVFDRFHRTDPARDRASGGAGLGLAIVQAIARAHGGGVRAGESIDGGARLVMFIQGFAPGSHARQPATPARGDRASEIPSA
jgi:two-component system OmpR family sensor kinase